MRAPLPWHDPSPGSLPERSARRHRRTELFLVVPLLAVCALCLETSADILPSQALAGPVTLARVLLALAFVALILAGARGSDFRTALDPPIAVLVLATAISTHQHTDGAALRFLLTAVAFYYLTVGLVRFDPEARAALPLLALVAVAIPTVVGLAQLVQHVPTTFYRRGLFGPVDSPTLVPGLRTRAIGTFTNPNLLAAYLLLLGPFAALPAVTARRRGIQVVAGSLALLTYAGVLVTFSRAAVLAVLVSAAVAVLAVLARRPHGRLLSRAAGPALAITASGLLVAGLSGVLGRVSGRSEAFTLATRALDGHLATGVGPRQAGVAMDALGHDGPSYAHAHDLWLTWLLEAGVAGFVAIALVTVGGLVAAARTAAAGSSLGVAGLAALTGFCVMSLVDNPANAERVAMSLWLVLGLVMADTRPGWLNPRPADHRGPAVMGGRAGDETDLAAVPHVVAAGGRDDHGPSAPPTIPLARRTRGPDATSDHGRREPYR
ncbi:O-antigen ligase domain-containing protein [Frankia sp. CNm7]|uniref:O-antigen ligase n=1 Tax=Frankia nepalensis TaxID=1836974 RepID=A0A937R9I9_9ACTN|nr:hypothetical protein [Frankia nepalensis]MBL7495789.1 O-antigen ligase domain-containing protein [Frankia nepalensis]MBL7513277.1 O-antigen ligase domain-containing protein [Frankia nepalensis]MBL7523771.1 O-antigen ligase domain-containing protein [Frankia nepalensis]MBL7628158.1 hypothetical protein [Frankia nepalensis]